MDNEKYDSLTYRETCAYHEQLRSTLFEFFEEEYSVLGLKFSEISYKDAVEADSWKELWKNSARAASWSWVRLYGEYHSRSGARRFDMAVKKNGALLGLCYGMLERNRLILKLHALERSPLSKNIAGKLLDITLNAANYYAMLNDVSEIWLCDPVSPAHVRLYQSKGYAPQYDRFDDVTHLMRRLK